MDNLARRQQRHRRACATSPADRHTWVMSFLYIGTFGSFIGYSFAFGLVLQIQFAALRTPLEAASLTFLGPLLGSLIRPVGGRLADRLGGARGHVLELRRHGRGHRAWCSPPRRASSLRRCSSPGSSLLFVLTRARQRLDLQDDPGDLPRPGAGRHRGRSRRDAAATCGPAASPARVIGIAGAVGALGGLLINLAFRQSFLTTQSGDTAFWSFLAFYVVCAVVSYVVYLRPAPAEATAPRAAYAGA